MAMLLHGAAHTSMAASLGQALSAIPGFMFDDHEVPITSTLRHDLVRAGRTVSEIGVYLDEINSMFRSLQQQHRHPLLWYLDGRDRVHEMVSDIARIDLILAQTVSVVEKMDSIVIESFIAKIEVVNDKFMHAKQLLLRHKKLADMAASHRELQESIIGDIGAEMDECADILQNLSLVEPNENPMAQVSVDQIVEKLKFMDLGRPAELLLHMNQAAVFDDFQNLEKRTEPLNASISFVPYKVDEFERTCGSAGILFESEVKEIHASVAKLNKQWALLQESVLYERHRLVEKQWHTVFLRVISETSGRIRHLSSMESNHQQFGSSYRLCANFMGLLERASKRGLLNTSLRTRLQELAGEWSELNLLLTATRKKSVLNAVECEYSGLKKFHTKKVTDQPAIKTHGLGLDLGIGVQSTNVPFSIQKHNRVRDFLGDQENLHPSRKSANILHEFQKLSLEESPEFVAENDDDETLVNSKTPQSIHEDSFRKSGGGPVGMDLSSPFTMQYGWPLLEERTQNPSRIPMICSNYHLLKVKPLAKRGGSTRIPTISPDHPAFLHSPEKPGVLSRSQLYGHSRQSSHSTIVFPSPTPLRNEPTAPKTLPKARLSLKDTPNLSYLSPTYSQLMKLPTTMQPISEVVWHLPAVTPKARWK